MRATKDDRQGTRRAAHLSCPFCASYDVDRLFLGSLRNDSCECRCCGAAWDEDAGSGEYLGRADRASVFMRPPHEPIGTPDGS